MWGRRWRRGSWCTAQRAAALLLLSAGGAPAFVAPAAERVAAAVAAPHAPLLADRLRDVTDPFVGAPYHLSALGEGSGIDPDPRLRFDAFDCTTFVETAMALALAHDVTEARALLDVIRYRDGKVDYLARRHFPEAEWIPELTALGFLKDITPALAKETLARADKTLTLSLWKRSKKPGVPTLPDARIPEGTFSLTLWPLKDAQAHAREIPAGTVLHLVRVDFKNVPVRVSHQGLVLEKNGRKFLRHAADRMYHSVTDEPLDHFFARMVQYGKWPVAGVHLTQVTEPADWQRLLRAAAPDAAAPAPL